MELCRICLKTNYASILAENVNKLHKISKVTAEIYSVCIGITLDKDNENLPQEICSSCQHNLVKSYTFKQQCLESHKILNTFLEQLSTFEPSPEEYESYENNFDCTDAALSEINENQVNNFEETEFLSYKTKDLVEVSKESFDQIIVDESQSTEYQENNTAIDIVDDELEVLVEPTKPCSQLEQIVCDNNSCENSNFGMDLNIRESDDESNYSLESLDFGNIPVTRNRSINSEGNKIKVVCPICGMLKTQKHMYNHIKTHDNRENAKLKKKKKDYRTLCPDCGKMVHLKEHAGIHKDMPYEERPYGCDQCDKRFKLRSALQGHKRTHTDEKRFECPHCDERFRGYHTKMQHITQIHTGEFRFECHICDHKFWLMARYKDHLKRAHKIETNQEQRKQDRRAGPAPTYKCDQCNKSFKSQRFLREHMKTHDEEEKMNNAYICPECDLRCQFNRELRKHIEEKHVSYELPPPNVSLKWRSLMTYNKKLFTR